MKMKYKNNNQRATMNKTITINNFEDQSIFQGITQYFDDQGVEWRRKDFMTFTQWYKLEGDIFVFQGTLNGNYEDMPIRKAHNIFLAHDLGE